MEPDKSPCKAISQCTYFNHSVSLEFQSTGSVWSPTLWEGPKPTATSYFNPRAPYGARLLALAVCLPVDYFNPRAPYGARLFWSLFKFSNYCYFNPRAPYGARRLEEAQDICQLLFQSTGSVWSPTCLIMEGVITMTFQSTGSVWSPTTRRIARRFEKSFQSTGSVWSPTARSDSRSGLRRISIHGLRMEPDFLPSLFVCRSIISIHGLRMEPDFSGVYLNFPTIVISIHGLRMEPDALKKLRTSASYYFNPRAPYGARHV